MANRRGLVLITWVFFGFSGSLLSGAAPVEIQVAMEPGAPITAPQEWAKMLGKLGLERVQIRSQRPNELPEITAEETVGSSHIKVVAILSRRNELVLPDRRFKPHDLTALRDYFEKLPLTAAEGNAPRGKFALTDAQFQSVFGELSTPIDFSTVGLTRLELVQRLGKSFSTPVERNNSTDELLSDSQLVIEMRGMAAGTALALALREKGMALKPEKLLGEPLQIRLVRYDRDIETWPVGWQSQASPRQLAPRLFEYLNIEIDGYSLAKALEALKPRLEVPVLMDQWILKREGIEPGEVQVKLPHGRTYLKKAVDRILSQARLQGELRVDELGQPFYWVTQFGKDSLHAE
ncbi:MAG: hypothetical protein KDA57_04255 [Planctomycetales bacterium]|nr:hypothetical protein [Planctomycetales bacterium]